MNHENPSLDRRAHILKATTKLLNEKGLQGFSFESVAKEAGLSRQLLRYYFSDLDHLVSDLSDHLGNVYREALVEGIVEVRQVERLDFFMDFLFDLTDEFRMPDNLKVYDALIAYSVGSVQVKERMRAQYKTLGQVIAQELAIAHPTLNGPSCEELSFLFVSMMHADWSFVASLGFSRQQSKVTRGAIERLINAYLNDPTKTTHAVNSWLQES